MPGILNEETKKRLRKNCRFFTLPPSLEMQKVSEHLTNKYGISDTVLSMEDVSALAAEMYRVIKNQGLEGLRRQPKRKLRKYPWTLYHSRSGTRFIDDVKITSSLLSCYGDNATGAIANCIHVYLKNYDEDAPGNEVLREFIENRVVEYEGKSRRLLQWQERSFLFWRQGPLALHQRIGLGSNSKGFESAIKDLGFKGDTAAGNFLATAVKYYFSSNEVRLADKVKNLHARLTINDGSRNIRFPQLLPVVANQLLTLQVATADATTQDALINFFLVYLGDPRVPGNRAKWDGVSAEARKIVQQWLSKKTLDLFFTIVKRTALDSMWSYRQKFWSAYLPHITNTWVFLGPDAAYIARSIRDANLSYGVLDGATSNQSVFLISIGNYVFGEWSHNGKLRVWRADHCPVSFGANRMNQPQIKNAPNMNEWVHSSPSTYFWQRSVANWIFRYTGIAIESRNYR